MRTEDRTGAAKAARAPGLDGVRALAVIAVVAFHEQIAAVPGGFLGVDVFFVLSGYLITDLLVARWEGRGRLDLPGFWARRARRLLPALALVLVAVAAAAAVIEPGQLPELRPALLAAATYSSNWWQAFHHQPYFSIFGPPPALQHLWSLAVEEQFYLAWPLILTAAIAVGRRRRTRAAAVWLAAAASATAMTLLYTPGADPSRVYYGTDTHAVGLLAGAALAMTWPLRETMAAPATRARRLDAVGIAGLMLLAWAAGHFSGADAALYPAGMIVIALAAGAVVLAAASPGAVGRWLSWPPLRWVGVRSYGIYLWHWPVIALTVAAAGPIARHPWMLVFDTALAIALAAASWRWVEEPILRNGFRATFRTCYRVLIDSTAAARRSPVRAVPALSLAAVLTVACTAGYRVLNAPTSTPLAQQIAQGAKVSAASQQAADGAVPVPTSGTAPGQAVSVPPGGRLAGPAGSVVTAVGDSVMLAAAPQLRSSLRGIYIDARVDRQMTAGLRTVRKLADAGDLRAVVVVGLGSNGPVTSDQLRQLLAETGPSRELVLVNTFVPLSWEGEVNRAMAAMARDHANVVLADWWRAIHDRTSLLWPDAVHPRPGSGAFVYARVVAAAVQAARDRLGHT